MKDNIKIGDVFEIETSKGKAYLQYIKVAEDQNDLEKIRIFYKLYKNTPSNINEILKGEYFFLSFILKEAYKQSIIKKVGNVDLPNDLAFPHFLRTEHLFKENWWQIVNVETWKRESVEYLSDEQKSFLLGGHGMILYL